MSLLSALVRAYDRLPEAPPFGYSSEKIGFCVVLNPDGTVAEVVDLRADDKKRSPRMMLVPAPFKRPGVTPRPMFLWDNANYALGTGTIEDKNDLRFKAFQEKHLELLAGESDAELLAFRSFLEKWVPEDIVNFAKIEDVVTAKVVFAHCDTYREHFLHLNARAKELWTERSDEWRAVEGKQTATAVCLVKGVRLPIARTHSAIKGIPSKSGKDADTLIGFNLDAFTSYGHEQGDNAPVSEAAAFAYTTALNRFLADHRHRIQIGDASTVFWADSADSDAVKEAEALAAGMFEGQAALAEDDLAAAKVRDRLEAIRNGQNLPQIAPELTQGVRFHILGLAPNAARLSVRLWWESDFGTLTANYQRYLADTEMQPPPRDDWPPLWRYLAELAVLGKRENVPPLVAGDWMRAIVTGTPYPLTLLSTVLMRIRADGEVNALRAAILKSVLIRNLKKEAPVALDPANTNKGYILGRLFAVYEEVQRAALGGNVNATIKDKFYGAASATPQKVFRTLDAGSQNHFSKLRKQSPGRAVNLEKLLTSITDLMDPGDDPIPASLTSAEQALFGIGYYHQRSDFFRKREEKADDNLIGTDK